MEINSETITKEEVKELIRELIIETQKLEYLQKEILTFKEAAKFLSLSESALYKLTSKKGIPFYTPGGKIIYFRKSELEYWIFSGKVTTNEEFDTIVDNYLSRNHSKSIFHD